jgi:hypothetical protein
MVSPPLIAHPKIQFSLAMQLIMQVEHCQIAAPHPFQVVPEIS